MKILAVLLPVIFCASSASAFIYDFNYKCVAVEKSSGSKIELAGGVDPGGGLTVDVKAAPDWQNLNGVSLYFQIINAPRGFTAMSTRYQTPHLKLIINEKRMVHSHAHAAQLFISGLAEPLAARCWIRAQ